MRRRRAEGCSCIVEAAVSGIIVSAWMAGKAKACCVLKAVRTASWLVA